MNSIFGESNFPFLNRLSEGTNGLSVSLSVRVCEHRPKTTGNNVKTYVQNAALRQYISQTKEILLN